MSGRSMSPLSREVNVIAPCIGQFLVAELLKKFNLVAENFAFLQDVHEHDHLDSVFQPHQAFVLVIVRKELAPPTYKKLRMDEVRGIHKC